MKTNLKAIGPGLIWAAAAIGVSHLVQSTRAGAAYGFELIWFIVLINLIKYPFFKFGPRYASATGESLMHGAGSSRVENQPWFHLMMPLYQQMFCESLSARQSHGVRK